VTRALTGLTPNTDYEWTVFATRGACSSAESVLKKGHTGQDAVQDTGSATIEVRPSKTNSYRPSSGWGYIGEAVGQGYWSSSSSNYTGTIDYGGAATLKAAVVAALGTNGSKRWDNLVVSAANVYLFKKSGVGTGGSVPLSILTAPPRPGSGALRTGAALRSRARRLVAALGRGRASAPRTGPR